MKEFTLIRCCPFCRKDHFVTVFIKDYKNWLKGELAQTAFPYLNATEREQVISGMCPDCQKDIFGDEEDADECLAESLASTGQWW